MTADELLDDLTERLDRGHAELVKLKSSAAAAHALSEYDRLTGKEQGLALVKDWLRSYR